MVQSAEEVADIPNATSLDKNRSVRRSADDAADGRAWARREGGNGVGGQDTALGGHRLIFYLSALIISVSATQPKVRLNTP